MSITHQTPVSATAQTHRRARRDAGVALIEVMVAVLLFAIGILGLVGLQASMTQAQTESKVRADAANLIDELAAQMWADMGTPLAAVTNLAAYNAGGCGGNSRCSAWVGKLAATLPGGTLTSLTVDPSIDAMSLDFGKVVVEIGWTLPNATTAHKYVATFNVAATGP